MVNSSNPLVAFQCANRKGTAKHEHPAAVRECIAFRWFRRPQHRQDTSKPLTPSLLAPVSFLLICVKGSIV